MTTLEWNKLEFNKLNEFYIRMSIFGLYHNLNLSRNKVMTKKFFDRRIT